jgi:hypothetical protein
MTGERPDVPAPPHRQPRLRHRPGAARRLQPPLPAVPRDQRAAKRASSRPTGTASSARSASASSSTTSASTRRRAPAARVRHRSPVDGHLAAGQAALHRPADRPPPARAGRDLLQLGHRQAAAPQLLPQRLHLRAPGGQHRVHRERRAGLAAHLPRLLPDRRTCARPGRASSTTSSCRWSSRTWSATSTRAAGDDRRNGRLAAARQLPDPGAVVSLFFRNKGAYLVGKIINGFVETPLALPILHGPDGSW